MCLTANTFQLFQAAIYMLKMPQNPNPLETSMVVIIHERIFTASASIFVTDTTTLYKLLLSQAISPIAIFVTVPSSFRLLSVCLSV